VHSWGHDEKYDNVTYVVDISLLKSKNLIGGQKEKTTDSFNVNYGRDFKHEIEADIAAAHEGAKCPECEDGYLHEKKGIELGHIFKYDTYYSDPHGAAYVDKDGKEKPMWMGAYGIGVGRLMASAVEMNHDEKGIVWPKSIAPFDVHIVTVGEDEVIMKTGEIVHEMLMNDYEVIFDDREDVSAGVKFNDADLIGVPVRLVVSGKTLAQNSVEIKGRDTEETVLAGIEEKELKAAVEKLLAGTKG
jgi:prolyl-tRNA synthetase